MTSVIQNSINNRDSLRGQAKQAIINSNYDIAQTGTSFTNPANGDYTLDNVKVGITAGGYTPPSNVIHSRQSLTVGDIPGSFYFYRINPDGAGSSIGASSEHFITRFVEGGTRNLCGLDVRGNAKKISISFWARSSISTKKLGFYLIQNYGTGGSPTSEETITGDAITLTDTWAKYTHTFDSNTLVGKTFGTGNDDYLALRFVYVWGATTGTKVGESTAHTYVGSGNIDIAQIQMNQGDTVLEYYPISFSQELIECMRYYELSYNYGTTPGTIANPGRFSSFAESSTSLSFPFISFKVRKRSTPTVTVYSPVTGTSDKVYDNTGTTDRDAVIGTESHSGFELSTTGSSAGNLILAQWESSSRF